MLWLFFSWYSVKNAKNRVSVVTLALRANQVKQLEQWEGVWVDTGAVSGDGTKKSRATSGPVIELREGTILKTPQINPHKHTASPFVFPDWTMFRILWLFFFSTISWSYPSFCLSLLRLLLVHCHRTWTQSICSNEIDKKLHNLALIHESLLVYLFLVTENMKKKNCVRHYQTPL